MSAESGSVSGLGSGHKPVAEIDLEQATVVDQIGELQIKMLASPP